MVGTNIQVVCLRKIMRETEGGREEERAFPWRDGKKVYLLINFSITSRLALSDAALFLQRNVPALYLLRVLISDLVLGNSHELDYSPSEQKEEKVGEIFFFHLLTTQNTQPQGFLYHYSW